MPHFESAQNCFLSKPYFRLVPLVLFRSKISYTFLPPHKLINKVLEGAASRNVTFSCLFVSENVSCPRCTCFKANNICRRRRKNMQIAFWLLEKFSRKGRPQTTTTKVSTYYFFAPVFLDRNLYINCCKMHSSTLLKEYYLFTVKFAVLGIIFHFLIILQ